LLSHTNKFIVVTHEQIHCCDTRTNTLLSHTNKFIVVTQIQIHCCHTKFETKLWQKRLNALWNKASKQTFTTVSPPVKLPFKNKIKITINDIIYWDHWSMVEMICHNNFSENDWMINWCLMSSRQYIRYIYEENKFTNNTLCRWNRWNSWLTLRWDSWLTLRWGSWLTLIRESWMTLGWNSWLTLRYGAVGWLSDGVVSWL
jgi:hypothetical protein